jgi:hypothetical protein
MGEKGRLSVGCIIGIAALVLFLVIPTIFAAIDWSKEQKERAQAIEPFKSHLNEYLLIPELKTITPAEDTYIKGKVITVDTSEIEIDEMTYFKLPEELVAQTPEEVATIIWLKWEDVLVGHYTPGGGDAYRITCEVTIIDKEQAAIVGQKTFRGSAPPETVVGTESGYGERPIEDVVDYIRLLPRR